MGERKVLNKYYPPDFDPLNLPKISKETKEKQWKVRMMLPMSVRCETCGTFLYKGTKFNTRMEPVKGEDYLGMKVWRFYFKCHNCSAEFTMKTDWEHQDYEVEKGAKRNYEQWKAIKQQEAEVVAEREDEERGDAMKALENRTKDSKRELEIQQSLQAVRSQNAIQDKISTEDVLAAINLMHGAELGEDDDDDEDIQNWSGLNADERDIITQGFHRRINDEQFEKGGVKRKQVGLLGDEHEQKKQNSIGGSSSRGRDTAELLLQQQSQQKKQEKLQNVLILVKNRQNDKSCVGGAQATKQNEAIKESKERLAPPSAGSMFGLIAAYSSDEHSQGDEDAKSKQGSE